MKTLTENILSELIDGIKEPAGLPDVLKKYGHSKGPLYVALAQATSSLTEKVAALATQYQETDKECQYRQEEVKGAEQKLQGLDISTKSKTQELASLEDKVKQVQAVVDIGKDLTGVGFGLNELIKLRDILTEIGAENGVAPGKAAKHFFDKVDNYQKLVSLESELKASKTAASQAKAEANKWQSQAKAAQVKSKGRQTSINITEKLLARGVKEADLPQWAGILAKAGVSPEKVAEALDKFASIEKLCHDREVCIKKMETQIQILTARVKALSEERQQVVAAIADLREKALAEIEAVSQKTSQELGYYSQNVNQALESIRQKTVEEVESASETALQNMQALVDKSAEYVALERQAVKLEEEIRLGRAFTSQDKEEWRQVSREVIHKLLVGVIIWSRVDIGNNTSLSRPTTSLSSKLSYFEWDPARLDEVLEWALTGTYNEQERKMMAGKI